MSGSSGDGPMLEHTSDDTRANVEPYFELESCRKLQQSEDTPPIRLSLFAHSLGPSF